MWLFPSHCLDFCFMPQHTAADCLWLLLLMLLLLCFDFTSPTSYKRTHFVIFPSFLLRSFCFFSFPLLLYRWCSFTHFHTQYNKNKVITLTNQPKHTKKPNPSNNTTLESSSFCYFPSHNVVVSETSDFFANAFRFSFSYHFVFFVVFFFHQH